MKCQSCGKEFVPDMLDALFDAFFNSLPDTTGDLATCLECGFVQPYFGAKDSGEEVV